MVRVRVREKKSDVACEDLIPLTHEGMETFILLLLLVYLRPLINLLHIFSANSGPDIDTTYCCIRVRYKIPASTRYRPTAVRRCLQAANIMTPPRVPHPGYRHTVRRIPGNVILCYDIPDVPILAIRSSVGLSGHACHALRHAPKGFPSIHATSY